MTTTRLHPVALRNIPVDAWNDSRRWMEELLREFTVIASSDSGAGVPRALLAFVEETTARFSHLNQDTNLELEAAQAAGRSHIDLTLQLPEEARTAALELWNHILRAAEFCREGDLLITAPTERMWAFLRWYLHQVADQLAGGGPAPWDQDT
ncbi:MAG TPA: hypothetical protein VLB67_11405 [Acidimicrobiia bacterium]|nr:hypothetical protein [Acidimicrobiia bacterium]